MDHLEGGLVNLIQDKVSRSATPLVTLFCASL